MTPDDFDARLRHALTEASSAWQPTPRPVADMVGDVRRRRMHRRRTMAAAGSAVVLSLAAGLGAYSYSSGTGHREASGASVHAPATSAAPNTAAAPGAPPRSAPLAQAQGAVECISVTPGSGVSRCAGTLNTAEPTGPGFAASNSADATSGANPNPVSVTVEVGHDVVVRLPATSSGSWEAPTVVSAATLSAGLRRELAGNEPSGHAGAVRVVARAQAGKGRSGSTVFDTTKPGDVVITATLVGACAPVPRRATTKSGSCFRSLTQWVLVVVVVAVH